MPSKISCLLTTYVNFSFPKLRDSLVILPHEKTPEINSNVIKVSHHHAMTSDVILLLTSRFFKYLAKVIACGNIVNELSYFGKDKTSVFDTCNSISYKVVKSTKRFPSRLLFSINC